MNAGSFVYPIDIHATPQQTWDALTQPERVAEYCPGAQLITDWSIGSPIQVLGTDGVPLFEGKVLRADAPHLLSYTYDAAPAPGKPIEPSKVTVSLESIASATRLTLTHSDFVPYTKLRDAVGAVWPPILSRLKSFLEQ